MEFIQEIKLIYCFKNRTTHTRLTSYPDGNTGDVTKNETMRGHKATSLVLGFGLVFLLTAINGCDYK